MVQWLWDETSQSYHCSFNVSFVKEQRMYETDPEYPILIKDEPTAEPTTEEENNDKLSECLAPDTTKWTALHPNCNPLYEHGVYRDDADGWMVNSGGSRLRPLGLPDRGRSVLFRTRAVRGSGLFLLRLALRHPVLADASTLAEWTRQSRPDTRSQRAGTSTQAPP